MDNPSDHWKLSIYLVFLDHLVEEISTSKRVPGSKQRVAGCCFFASNLSPASLLHLTPEIVGRLRNAYQRDLPRKVDFVDEVERWNIRWALADDKPERLLDTPHVTNLDLYSPGSS